MSKYLLPILLFLLYCKDSTGQPANKLTPAEESALALFQAYRPNIERDHGPVLYQRTITGDLNGDSRPDVVIEFGIGSRGGGNGILFKQAAIYLGTTNGVQVVGDFQPNFCFAVTEIKNRLVTVEQLEACIDPWPRIMAIHSYTFEENRLIHKSETRLTPPRETRPN